jgi:Cytochrome b
VSLVRVRVWDAPLRLFHWTLFALTGFSWWSGEQGGHWLDWHAWSGCAILALVLFRIAWGFVGSDSARFAVFVRGPRASIAYLQSLLARQPKHYLGHNPLGGWMIVALLLVLLVQTLTGLFGNDDSDYEAPLAHWIGHDASSIVSAVHGYNFDLLLVLVGLHVVAVLMHVVLRRDDLLSAMFSGSKRSSDAGQGGRMVSSWRGLYVFAAAGICVAVLVWLGAREAPPHALQNSGVSKHRQHRLRVFCRRHAERGQIAAVVLRNQTLAVQTLRRRDVVGVGCLVVYLDPFLDRRQVIQREDVEFLNLFGGDAHGLLR